MHNYLAKILQRMRQYDEKVDKLSVEIVELKEALKPLFSKSIDRMDLCFTSQSMYECNM